MFGFVSLGVSFASLVIPCAALYWSRMARIEAAGAVERSRYALESSRKHVGLPYDHKIVQPHSKVCPDCVFALEGPKIPPSMAEVR